MSPGDLLIGVGSVLLVGAGVRALLIGVALRRGEARPSGRARVEARIFGAVALLGAVILGAAPWIDG